MRNLKISKKLIISYGIVLLLFIASIVVSIAELVTLSGKVETFYAGPYTVVGAANTLNANFEEMQKSVFRAISTENSAVVEDAIADVDAAAANIQAQYAIIQENFAGDMADCRALKGRVGRACAAP